MTKKKPEPEEQTLFRSSMVDVTPLALRNDALLQKPRPKPRRIAHPRQDIDSLEDRLSDHVPLAVSDGGALSFVRPGLQRQVLRRLRRGGRAVEDELDLHGLTVAQARLLLVSFLDEARGSDVRTVRIVHGKGMRSENREGVLREKVAAWLMQREDVLAFTQARVSDGGSGAVVVLLKGLE